VAAMINSIFPSFRCLLALICCSKYILCLSGEHTLWGGGLYFMVKMHWMAPWELLCHKNIDVPFQGWEAQGCRRRLVVVDSLCITFQFS